MRESTTHTEALTEDGIEIVIGQTESGLYQAISNFADTYRNLWRSYKSLLSSVREREEKISALKPVMESCKHIGDRDVKALVTALETLFEPGN